MPGEWDGDQFHARGAGGCRLFDYRVTNERAKIKRVHPRGFCAGLKPPVLQHSLQQCPRRVERLLRPGNRRLPSSTVRAGNRMIEIEAGREDWLLQIMRSAFRMMTIAMNHMHSRTITNRRISPAGGIKIQTLTAMPMQNAIEDI